MISIKNRVFNYLTSSQKSQICTYLSKFTKKHSDKTQDEILDLFIEDEKYYLEIDSSRHPWIVDYIEEEQLYKDLNLYINDQIKKYKFKELQKPYIEKQKELQKQSRKKAQEFKMSKEPPTKAQISYYKSLCKKYNENIVLDSKNSSKLDFRNSIQNILDKNSSALLS